VLKAERRWLLAVLAALAPTALWAGAPAAAPVPQPTTHTVVIEAVRFDPQELTVSTGDTIVWVNRDPFPHTVTAVGKQFDSHQIVAGGSWKYIARKAGVFAYACSLHPGMLGTLRVQ
jgi:plastocyanin